MNEETVRGPLEHPVGRWFVLNRYGVPMLCAGEDDARKEAASSDRLFPRKAPHRAVHMVPADDLERLRAENERLRAALSGAVTVLDSLRTYGLAKYDCAQSRSGSLVYVAPTIDEAKELLTPNTQVQP